MADLEYIAESMTWGGRDPNGVLVQGDLSAASLFACLMTERLKADALLTKVLGFGGVIRLPFRTTFDWGKLPVLHVFAALADSTETATRREDTQIEVISSLIFDAQGVPDLRTDSRFQPDHGALIEAIRKVYRQNKQMVDVVDPTDPDLQAPLAMSMDLQPISYHEIAAEVTDRFAVVFDVSAIFRVAVDSDTGKLKQIENSGGS